MNQTQDDDTQEDRMSDNAGDQAPATRLKMTVARRRVAPPPQDAPVLSFADVAAYLRTTPCAVRRLVDGRADGSDGELGDRLRSWLVKLSPRRRYVRRDPFLQWLRGDPGDAAEVSK